MAIQSIICPHGLKRKSGALSTTTSNLYALNGRNACFPQRKNISEIAENTGFASRNFFASTFKQCVGKTPAQYRKETLNT
ncbi:MAG: helix-turn-helix domain-containing protein [Ruthenibacterium lactatiformans]